MDGVSDADEDGVAMMLNGRLTAAEHTKASAVQQQDDGDEGELEFVRDEMYQLDEGLWYILTDKLDGVEP
eukprot:818617-Pyramimonas_sp.AAC.1